MEERVVLVRVAIKPVPMVIAGSTREDNVWSPPDGNQPSFREKAMIRRSPSQKFGMESPIMAKNILILSCTEPCRVAA